VLPGVPQSRIAPSWKLCEIGVARSFCFEIVSSDVVKGYEDTPVLLGGLGTRELIVSIRRHQGGADGRSSVGGGAGLVAAISPAVTPPLLLERRVATSL